LRKVVDGLDQRGYARTERDVHDSRRLNVVLTPAGEAYARVVVGVIEALNRELRESVDATELAAADAVRRAAIFDEAIRERAARLVGPRD
jgi:DNA-binding MarR family transcriptional regulator